MVQAGFLRATTRTALNSHRKATICLDNCLAEGDHFFWAAVIGVAGKCSVSNVIECCGSSVEYCAGAVAFVILTGGTLKFSDLDNCTLVLFSHLVDLRYE